MTNITLNKLILTNFKGIKSLEVDFQKETTIKGDNATGKTSIFDAFTWLLFDKDSLNRANFDIKTFDKNGDVIHGLDHSVEAELFINESLINLRKVYSEVWTKKRGSTEETFTGHSTDYFINEVPVKKSEYDQRIESIIPEDQFKLLTNPHYFNEILDKKQRREIILGLEKVEDSDVLESMKPRPKELIEKLESYNITEIQAMAKASMKKANDEIKELPVRIDELSNQVKEYDFKKLETDKKEVQARLDLVNGSITNARVLLDDLRAKTRAIAEKKLRLEAMEEEVEKAFKKAQRAAETDLSEYQAKVERLKRDIESNERLYKLTEQDFHTAKDKLKRKRDEWVSWSEEEPRTDLTCSFCKQSLPEDQIDESVKKFNARKSEELEKLEQEGKKAADEMNEAKDRLLDLSTEIQNLANELRSLEEMGEPVVEDVEKPELRHEYYLLKAEIEHDEKVLVEETPTTTDESIEKQKRDLQEQLSQIEEQLAAKARNKEIGARIKELGAKEKELAKTYEQQEKLLKQSENFTRTKADLISGKINAHFENLTFKLFDVQINGGVNETCEAMIDGVPYSGANKAAKINAGLDVINTLSKVYGVTAPVFIDNAESVNELTETESQIIKLYVSKDKKLKIS